MAKEYYYFVASLPAISFDSKSSMSIEDFLESCDELLTLKDSLLVRELLEGSENINSNVEACELWTRFDNALKNQMACCRAKRIGRDPYDYIRGEKSDDIELEKLTDEALKIENLLEAEKLVDKKKWEYLDEIELSHHFEIANIIIYGDEGKQKLEEYKILANIKE